MGPLRFQLRSDIHLGRQHGDFGTRFPTTVHQDDSDLHLHRDGDHRGVWWCNTHHQQWQSVSWHPVLYQCALHGYAHLIAWKRSLAKFFRSAGWRLATGRSRMRSSFGSAKMRNKSMASWKTMGLPWIATEMFGMAGGYAHGFLWNPKSQLGTRVGNDGAPNHPIAFF